MPAKRNRIIRRRPVSKIAHLPLRIREGIAARLRDGYSLRSILAWLNSQASVRRALQREQIGRSTTRITPSNLSLWIRTSQPKAADHR